MISTFSYICFLPLKRASSIRRWKINSVNNSYIPWQCFLKCEPWASSSTSTSGLVRNACLGLILYQGSQRPWEWGPALWAWKCPSVTLMQLKPESHSSGMDGSLKFPLRQSVTICLMTRASFWRKGLSFCHGGKPMETTWFHSTGDWN